MNYYGTRLSENISRREPEGYLLCLNVPVARTGTQEYLKDELGLPGGGEPVSVYRPEEEVFSPETMASFEGMPVTNDHPPEGVDVSNIRALQKGHTHNVRRGTGGEADLLLADLIITDPKLIGLILDGKREISCGYTYELCEEDGRYIQRKIRGNHVAVVDAGRAGPRVSIKDHKPERSKPDMKKSLVKKLVRMAKDGDPEAIEAVAELLEEVAEGEASTTAEEVAEAIGEAAENPAAVVQTEEGTTVVVDEDTLGEVISRLDRIISLLAPAAADDDLASGVAEVVEEVFEAASMASDPVAEEISAAMEQVLDPVATVILNPEGDEEGEKLPELLQTGDALRAALTAVRPALSRMSPETRRRVAGDIAARLRKGSRRGTTGADAYAAVASARRRTAPASADLGRRIMEKRNAGLRRNGGR